MNDDRRRSEILAARARSLATAARDRIAERRVEDVIVATVGEQQLGIPVDHAQEVVTLTGMTPVPGAPVWLRGVVHVRGRLVSVLDLARWWGIDHETAGKHLVIIVGHQGPLALLVEAVLEVRQIAASELLTDDEAFKARRGVTRVTRDLVLLLDVDHLLDDPDLIVGQAAAGAGGRAGGEHDG